MMGKSKKILVILLSIVVSCLLAGGFALAFFVGYNPYKPNQILIIDDGNSVSLYAETNDNYKSYRFRFENEEKGNIVIDTMKNILETYDMLRDGIEIGVKYDVSVCYVSDDSTRSTQYSAKIAWTPYTYLQGPVIFKSDNEIVWEDIENADYYEVHYNFQNGEKVLIVEQNYLDLQKIDGGQRDIYVVAKSNTEYYKESLKSNIIETEVIHTISNFTSIEFNSTTKILSLESTEKIEKAKIYIGQNQYDVQMSPILNGEIYIYSIDLTDIYINGYNIAVRPVTTDEYNIFPETGDMLYYYYQ